MMAFVEHDDNMVDLGVAGTTALRLPALHRDNSVTKPVLQALVLADHVYQDRFTGKWIIAGTFTTMTKGRLQGPVTVHAQLDAGVPVLPQAPPADADTGESPKPQAMHPATIGQAGSPFVYICLTDIHDSAKLELQFVSLRDHKLLMRCEMNIRCPDPLRTVEMGIPLPVPLPISHDGVYSMELLCEEELLGSWRVTAATRDAAQNEEKP